MRLYLRASGMTKLGLSHFGVLRPPFHVQRSVLAKVRVRRDERVTWGIRVNPAEASGDGHVIPVNIA